jgi:hypoxanthine phosphoribosyltransferase
MGSVVNILAVLGAIATIVSCWVAVVQFRRAHGSGRLPTWDHSLRTAAKLLKMIEGNDWGAPDIVIGLGRSGGIWGGWLAGNLGSLPFGVVDDKYPEVEFPGGEEVLLALRKFYPGAHKLLVVEGASSRGTTLNRFRERFDQVLSGLDVRYAVLYLNSSSDARIDYVGELGPEPWPTRFPWHSTDRYRPFLRDLFLPPRAQHVLAPQARDTGGSSMADTSSARAQQPARDRT